VVYWMLKIVLVGPILKVLMRPWSKGREHVPAKGPAIIASNHLSFSDSVIMPLAIPRRVTFPAKAEYFTRKGVLGWVMKMFFLSLGQVPMDRSGGRASAVALDTAVEILNKGELFGIYPEGTRSPDGRLYKGKTGVARLALRTGVPVIPVAMIGSDKSLPVGKILPNLRVRPGVVFGAPLDFSRYVGQENDRDVLRKVTDEVMYAIMTLSGQTYADVYAAKRKEELAAARPGGNARRGESPAGEGDSDLTDRPSPGRKAS
jgi:1-acyl-sn-glycerol-3-phosphate acyltransferase